MQVHVHGALTLTRFGHAYLFLGPETRWLLTECCEYGDGGLGIAAQSTSEESEGCGRQVVDVAAVASVGRVEGFLELSQEAVAHV